MGSKPGRKYMRELPMPETTNMLKLSEKVRSFIVFMTRYTASYWPTVPSFNCNEKRYA